MSDIKKSIFLVGEVCKGNVVSTWSSWMAHCLPPTGLCQRQKNHGDDEEQESVRGEPSLVIVPNLGNLDTISIPLAPSSLIRRRGSRV